MDANLVFVPTPSVLEIKIGDSYFERSKLAPNLPIKFPVEVPCISETA